MMRIFKFVLLVVILTSCKQKIGGPCSYQTVSEKVGISEIITSEQQIETVMLSGGDASSVFSYKLSSEELKKFQSIDFEKLKKDRQELTILVDKITNGSCIPYVIKDISYGTINNR